MYLLIALAIGLFSSIHLMAADAVGLSSTATTPFEQAIYRANQRVAGFETAIEGDNPATVRQAALELQKDPLAVRQVNNLKGDAFKTRLNQELGSIQAETKAMIRLRLAEHYKVPESQVTFFEATNPSNEIKVGQDWDVTARVNGKDVPLEISRPIVHESFYEAATGQKPPSTSIAEHFAEQQAVEVTNRAHAEAYGGGGRKPVYNPKTGKYEIMSEGGEIISGDKGTRLRDAEQLTKVMEHKSNLGANAAERMRQAGEQYILDHHLQGEEAAVHRAMFEADAQAWEMEQARQYTKQFERQAQPRVEKAQAQEMAQSTLERKPIKEIKIHERVIEGTKILKEVADGKIPMSEARERLWAMDPPETPESIIQKGASQIEALEKLRSPGKTPRTPGSPMAEDPFVQNVKDNLELKRLQRGEQAMETPATGEPAAEPTVSPPAGEVQTKVQGPSARNTNPEGQLEAMGIPDNRPVLTPEEADVNMPDRIDPNSPEGLNKTKYVQDPELAELVHPKGQKLAQAPQGNTALADQSKGEGTVLDRSKMKTGDQPLPASSVAPEIAETPAANKPASLLDGGKSSSSLVPEPKTPSKFSQMDQAVANKIMDKIGVGEIPESSSALRQGVNNVGNGAMAVVGTVATAIEAKHAGQEFGEGLQAIQKGAHYRRDALKAREAGNQALADKINKRAEEYEQEAANKMVQGAKDQGLLVGALAIGETATGGLVLGGIGAYKTGEASYEAGKSLSEAILKEEMAREVKQAQKEGRAPSSAAANARSLARVMGEASGMRWGMEQIMRDREAEAAPEKVSPKLAERRAQAIRELDDGLFEIARFERQMRNLDTNRNQTSPWVQQEWRRLLSAYGQKRLELQRINRVLGSNAGRGDGEAMAVRMAVSLLRPPEQIFPNRPVTITEPPPQEAEKEALKKQEKKEKTDTEETAMEDSEQSSEIDPESVVELPDVVGMTYDDAVKAIEAAGLLALSPELGKNALRPEDVGRVALAVPAVDGQLHRGDGVTPYLFGEAVEGNTVPDVVGLEMRQAADAIEAAGFTAGFELGKETDDPKKDMTVAGQAPGAGLLVEAGREINLFIYTYTSKTKSVPDLSGKTLVDARKALQDLGLNMSAELGDAASRQQDVNHIYKQSPEAWLEVADGSEVTVWIHGDVERAAEQISQPNSDGQTVNRSGGVPYIQTGLHNVAGEWSYLKGKGVCTISQSAEHLSMICTYTPSKLKGPHYEVTGTLNGNLWHAQWKCLGKAAAAKGERCKGSLTAKFDSSWNEIVITNAVDPTNEGWVGLVMIPKRSGGNGSNTYASKGCANLADDWKQTFHWLEKDRTSTWKLTRKSNRDYTAKEIGLGGASGAATFDGEVLTIVWENGEKWKGEYEWWLNDDCSKGTGTVVFSMVPEGDKLKDTTLNSTVERQERQERQ